MASALVAGVYVIQNNQVKAEKAAVEREPAVGAPGGLPEIRTVAIGPNREFLVNGKPFLPIFGWLQVPDNLPKLKAVGMNTVAGYHWQRQKNIGSGNTKDAAEYARYARKAGLYFISPYMEQHPAAMQTLAKSGVVLAWIHNDEPDLASSAGGAEVVPGKFVRETPGQVLARYEAIKAFDPMRPVLLTVTGRYIKEPMFAKYWTREQVMQLYPAYFKAADVPGHDNYPIYGWNKPEKLDWVSQGIRELRELAGQHKPTYIWIETQPGGQFAKPQPVTGVEIRNEVYQAIISGATAIGYFTHRFKPTFAEFGVPEENQKALREINEQLQRLAPVILSADATVQPEIEIEGGVAAQCLAKEHNGRMYIFAQNIDMPRRSGKATLAVAGLAAGTKVEVVDEGRVITAESGKFSDDFAPLAVHIYKIGLK
jgi:hypothetical protein